MGLDPLGLLGQTIDGHRLEKQVGEGGFSIVYRATHLGLDAPVAIKCLKLASALDPAAAESFARRFRDEGRILYRLSQGCLDIVRCTTSGTTQSPANGAMVPYMVLEWLEGRSLSAELRERRKQGMHGRTLRETLELLEPAAMALEYAHRQGVVHRDVKPGNLFLVASRTRATRIKVLDFGLAKILDDTIGITRAATRGNLMMCSPRYAAPEQFDPKLGAIGPWTDVFSMTLVLLELLRDERVRRAEGMAGCLIEATDPKARVRASDLGIPIAPAVEDVLARAVALDGRARPPSAGAFWSELTEAVEGAGRVSAAVADEISPSSFSDTVRQMIEPTMRLTREELEQQIRREPGGTLVMGSGGPPGAPSPTRPWPGAGAPGAFAAPVMAMEPPRMAVASSTPPPPAAGASPSSSGPMPAQRPISSSVPLPSRPSPAPMMAQPPSPGIRGAPSAPAIFVPPSSPSSPSVPSSGKVAPPSSSRGAASAWWVVLAVVLALGSTAAVFAVWRWHARHGGWGALSSSPR